MPAIPSEHFPQWRFLRMRALRDILRNDKDAIADVLSDLMHLADEMQVDWDEAEAKAEEVYADDWGEFRHGRQ